MEVSEVKEESVKVEEVKGADVESKSAAEVPLEGKKLNFKKITNFNRFFLEKLSKNQMKKLLKRQKMLELRKDVRKKHKEKQKLKRAIQKEQGIKSNKPSRKQLLRNRVDPSKAEISLAVDLSFEKLMSEKDLGSCVSQLMRIYTYNRRSSVPIPIHFTSLKEGSTTHQKLIKIGGASSWDIQMHEKSYEEIFEKDKIVYLTSESENVIEQLEKGTCYVIGGLVDHNSQKGLTHQLAIKAGIKTARLPISENIDIKTRKVLTINHVAEIMIGVANGKSWKEIFLEVLPARKEFVIKAENKNCKKENENKVEN